MAIITAVNLDTGETTDTNVELKQGGDNRFPTQGQKMYDTGLIKLLKALSANEVIRMVELHEQTSMVGKCNILQVPFRVATADMATAARSKLKKKLVEEGIIHEFSKTQVMLNPYMFLPRKDKNIPNSQYLTQRLWKYVVEDSDAYIPELEVFQETILPWTLDETKHIMIQKVKYTVS